jgi:hypothetical protein
VHTFDQPPPPGWKINHAIVVYAAIQEEEGTSAGGGCYYLCINPHGMGSPHHYFRIKAGTNALGLETAASGLKNMFMAMDPNYTDIPRQKGKCVKDLVSAG